jgi:hypothetical protein
VENHAGSDVAKAFKGVKAALHQNHGLLTASRIQLSYGRVLWILLKRGTRIGQPPRTSGFRSNS